jgi:hypothetical protein
MMTTTADHFSATRSDALLSSLSIMRLRDSAGERQPYTRARSWLQAVWLLVESHEHWQDETLLSCIDQRIAQFQADACQIQEQHPYQGVLPESEALDMATLLVACECGSLALWAPLVAIMGPLREAFMAALEHPDDAARAQQASQCLVEAIRMLKRDIAEQEGRWQ